MYKLLCGHNKNQFFHYFGLLHDLLHRQDLLNKWFERKLKLLVMFLSIFLENVFHQVGFTVRISKVTLIWRWNFSVTNNFNLLCMSLLFGVFFQLIENVKSYWSGTTTITSHSRNLERNFAEISSATLENLSTCCNQ